MALEKYSAGILLAGRSRLSKSLQLYQILHPSAATSPLGTGSSRGKTNLASMGVVQCCDLFWVRNCRIFAAECAGALSTVFVSSNLLLKSVEPQFSGRLVYLLLTETSLFDLLWTFCWRRRCCHRFDLLWADHCFRRPSVTLYPLETVCATKNCCST